MKIAVKFVYPLTEEQTNELKALVKNSEKHRTRQRAHAILLSSDGFSVDDIAQIFGVDRDTVSGWIDKWEQFGLEGLKDKPRPGNPGILTQSEKQQVIELCKETPRSIPNIIATLFDKTGKRVSDSTIKRILKSAKLTWKRVRKSLKSKLHSEEFEAAQLELKELTKQHEDGEIELWFFDESGFDLKPSVPYAWQPIGETIEVPSQKSTRLNVLGFITKDNQFESYCFEGTVNTDIVTACFDEFAKIRTSKPRYVIIDNASIHTSDDFLFKLPEWEEKGVIIRSLPTYCSELNLIEILWRFIKYYWLPFSAYLSFGNLTNEVENIWSKIGYELQINFAS
jgi:transposase